MLVPARAAPRAFSAPCEGDVGVGAAGGDQRISGGGGGDQRISGGGKGGDGGRPMAAEAEAIG